jgi:hypothetical protein
MVQIEDKSVTLATKKEVGAYAALPGGPRGVTSETKVPVVLHFTNEVAANTVAQAISNALDSSNS